MENEDKTIVCAECGVEFIFSAREQGFYSQKGFTSDPKRCKSCRQKRKVRSGRSRRMGEYRSPAFRSSGSSPKEYRSPAFNDGGNSVQDAYRGPAYKDEIINTENEYREPGFKESTPGEDEYRNPAYNYRQTERHEYRSPAFSGSDPAEYAPSYKRRKYYEIVCDKCGQKARVPFNPIPDRPVYCRECYRTVKEQED